MDILLLEWASAGGPDSRSLLPEGFGMVRALYGSLSTQGHRVAVLASRTLEKEFRVSGIDNVVLNDGDPRDQLEEVATEYEGIFVIAPESHGLLSDLTHSLSKVGKILSCPPSTVDLLSDKVRGFGLVSKAFDTAIDVPPFDIADANPSEIARRAREIGLPVVVKPRDGAGGAGATIVRTDADVRQASARLLSGGWKEGVVQAFVQGRPLSATFVARASSLLPLSINTQSMTLSGSPLYAGGSSPFPFPKQDRLWANLEALVQGKGLEGLMTMDFVFDGKRIIFMEINPRATTSTIGLSRILRPSLGKVITDPAVEGIEYTGCAQWATLPLQSSLRARDDLLNGILDLSAIVSPPFPVGPFYLKHQSKVLACVTAGNFLELPGRMNDLKESLSEMHVKC